MTPRHLLLLAAAPLAAALPPPPSADLPEGLELTVAAAPPLVRHPMMAGLDDRGRLFVADSAGVNWTPEQLEQGLPHRVVMLEDRDGDGVFDRSTDFADRLTYPQGACWLNGSLYVASPPGIWRFTDTDDDGVADRREMIVGGFEYTGNAADVHGPFAHPTNGRLYWCHGRKGHRVVQRDGTLVHAGKAAGVWSCRPDGGDVRWHALGGMDNPVEVDFTAEGDLLGTVNLFQSQPRADTLVLWQLGATYDRPDQLAVIAGLPRTRDTMPHLHNYGHVAVSGFTVCRAGGLDPAWRGDLFVTFFNTQKVVRTSLTPAGSGYVARTSEFLRFHDPDIHLTDVLEDGDGSLLVVNTGGWFRRGCPASLVEKPDLRGAIYRVRRRGAPPVADPHGLRIAWDHLPRAELERLARDDRWRVRQRAAALLPAPARDTSAAAVRDATQPRRQRHALEEIADTRRIDPEARAALLEVLAAPLDPALEHAAMYAALATGCFTPAALAGIREPAALRRLLRVLEQTAATEGDRAAVLAAARVHAASPDRELAAVAAGVIARAPDALTVVVADLRARLADPDPAPEPVGLTLALAAAHLENPVAQDLVSRIVRHPSAAARRGAWTMLAAQPALPAVAAWTDALGRALAAGEAEPAELPLLLEVAARLRAPALDPMLGAMVADPGLPPALRLKALGASHRPERPLPAASFALLREVAAATDSPAGRMEAARLLGRANLDAEQVAAIAPLLATSGPVELGELLRIVRRKQTPEGARLLAENLARSPFLGALEESAIRSAFSFQPPGIYEEMLQPAVQAAAARTADKRRRLEILAAHAGRGRPAEGQRLYAGSACAGCHRAGGTGQVLGPDLSRIGAIRNARDLLESILFPDATIAREYETQIVETSDRQLHLGTVRRDSAEALVLAGPGGEERTIQRRRIISQATAPHSLMPAGLEEAFTEQQLLDLVAWLRTLQ